ncbi:S-layer homology domain-containing protein [uncultured Megasphaera sp.]|uniref:S-layer homology domain-containing protein n=2 Tax=uncultured Megasphaera sp. TaxID=165188 RepID=UPI0025949AB6|nr:S-layer homology domain-containing protein [uncultured Megasphaera sp.]
MKKTKILAALAATMAVGATCAFAANPFADVPADSWAYKSVVTLANSGILQGVDGTHFQGNRNITRYEAAEITAKAMAHADRANAQQRAVINKLAHEFAGELNNLGVRVANLEDQVGTVKFSGTFKVDYNHKAASTRDYDVANYKGIKDDIKNNTHDHAMQPADWQSGETVSADKEQKYSNEGTYGEVKKNAGEYIETAKKAAVTGDASYSYTAQLTATAKVSKNVKANIGFKYKGTFNDAAGADKAYAHVNVANVQAKVADRVSVLAGRHTLTLGQGYIYDNVVDGVEAQVAADKVSVQAGYAKLKAKDFTDYKVGYVQARAAVSDVAGIGAYYGHVVVPNEPKDASTQVYGAFVQANVGKQVQALASYEKFRAYDSTAKQARDNSVARYGKVTYGKADFATPKSWDVWVDYLNADSFAFSVETGGVNGGTWREGDLADNIISWGIGADYIFAKNAKVQFKQSFASKLKYEPHAAVKTKVGEQTKVQLEFLF